MSQWLYWCISISRDRSIQLEMEVIEPAAAELQGPKQSGYPTGIPGRSRWANIHTIAHLWAKIFQQNLRANWSSGCGVATSTGSRQFHTTHEMGRIGPAIVRLQYPQESGSSKRIPITEICAEPLLARWAPHFDHISSTEGPAGNLGAVAGNSDPWRCGLATPSMGSWINSAGVLPHFTEDDPPPEAFERGRLVSRWTT